MLKSTGRNVAQGVEEDRKFRRDKVQWRAVMELSGGNRGFSLLEARIVHRSRCFPQPRVMTSCIPIALLCASASDLGHHSVRLGTCGWRTALLHADWRRMKNVAEGSCTMEPKLGRKIKVPSKSRHARKEVLKSL